jgi:hypothetical protein
MGMLNPTEREQQKETSAEPLSSERTLFSICFTPRPGSALAQFGRSWFGRVNGGATLQAFSMSGLGGVASIGSAPMPGRHLGLHAPFFAPVPLRKGVRLDEVRTHLASFAANRKPIETGPLQLTRTHRILTLRPTKPRPELDWLALQCFDAFDSYADRPETIESEQPHLNPHQRLLLTSFGQPNVMSEYRFSLTLTGPLQEDQSERLSNALRPLLSNVCDVGIRVDGLSLIGSVKEQTAGQPLATNSGRPVRLLGRYSLAG